MMRNKVCSTAIAGIAAVLGLDSGAYAQWTPTKPIRCIVPSSPGGASDASARLLADGMTKVIGQRVIVENRAGASGNIGSELAARAAPDGYAWLLINNAQAANVSLFRNLSYDLLRDFAPVTQVDAAPHVIVVHPTLPVKSAGELVKLAKARPGQLDYASAGLGTVTFLAAEIFNAQAGVSLRHVPYRGGGESLTSVVAGETIVYFSPLTVALAHMKSGRLRALAVTSRARAPVASDVPTVAESGYPKYEFTLWNGLLVPAKTPREIVTAIRSAAVSALNSPELRGRMGAMSATPVGSSPEDFAAFLKAEVDTIAAVVKRLNLKAD